MSFSINPAAMPPATTKPETFMLSQEQLANLPMEAKQALEQVDDLKYFLATAPANWQVDQIIRRYLLPTGEYVSCVLWRNLFHVTGTDIVRALAYRFQAFGRPVHNVKKFEEGIFSDLRNLKPGTDASLEEPKSAFLDLLYKNNCIRTQKKQKVFYWFSVPHDRLFLDALERDLKRERMGTESTTVAVQEPALSFVFDATQSLYEQLTKSMQQTAASEVGATLAAQQAHHNLMAHYQGTGNQYSIGMLEAQSGPTYRGRSQSIQSAVPIDYREQSTDGQQHRTQPSIHLAHSLLPDRHSRSIHNQLQPDSCMDDIPSYQECGYMPGEDPEYGQDFQRDTTFSTNLSQPDNDDKFDLAALDMTYSMMQPALRGIPTYAPMDSIGSESDFQSSMPRYRHLQNNGGFAVPYDIGNSMQTHAVEPLGYAQPPENAFGFGMPRNFSVSQGAPTYKQRRRRQSIPPSLILADNAHVTREQHGHRAATEPRPNGRPSSKHSSLGSRGRSMTNIPTDNRQAAKLINNSLLAYEESTAYKQDCQLSDMEQLSQRAGSSYEYGSPYSTTPYECPVTGCERLFKRLEHMKRHVVTHTQERPHMCDPCGKSFAGAENLAQHMRLHDRASSDSSFAALNGSQCHPYDSRGHDYSLEQQHYDGGSNYSDVDGSDASGVLRFDNRSFSVSRSLNEQNLSFHDVTDFALPDGSAEEGDEYGELHIDPVSFRDSLNPPSPRTKADQIGQTDTVEGEITPRESTSRMSSTSGHGSHDYVPGPGESATVTRSAPRSFGEDRWTDHDITPRQAKFELPGEAVRQDEMKPGASSSQMWS